VRCSDDEDEDDDDEEEVEDVEELDEDEGRDMEERVRRAGDKHVEMLEVMGKNVQGELRGVLLQVTESTKESLRRLEGDEVPEVMQLPVKEDGEGAAPEDGQATESGEMMEVPAEINPSL